MHCAVLLTAVTFGSATAAAQRSLFVVRSTEALAKFGNTVAAAGDIDHDGKGDFLVSQPTVGANGIGRVFLFSGATRAPLHSWSSLSAGIPFGGSAISLTDVNRDGVRDIAFTRFGNQPAIEVKSGLTGARIADLPMALSLGDAGDVNGDGVGDLITVWTDGSPNYALRLIRGDNGGLIATLPAPPVGDVWAGTTFRQLRDLTGDGRPELLVTGLYQGPAYVYDLNPIRVLRTLSAPVRGDRYGEQVAVADLDGDGFDEIAIGDQFRVHVFTSPTGSLQRTYLTQSTYGFVAAVGDLDSDGFGDLALDDLDLLRLVSGATGQRLADWPYSQGNIGRPAGMCAVGDLDGDQTSEVLLGNPSTEPPQQAGAIEVVATRILARSASLDGACGGGPFLPQLGFSRPVLGQVAQAACRDGAAGAVGALLFGGAAARTNLGVSTCAHWFQVNTVFTLFTTVQANWSVPISVPNVPTLAGFEFAMQVAYGPTTGPLGLDLSNAVHARVGF